MKRETARWLGIAAGLVLLVTGIYAQVRTHGFVAYDDPKYVYDNPMVRAGLTARGLAWAFTTLHASNWHPLTWLSHMLDVQLFGADPGPHHIVNVVLHALNAVLLFAWLTRATTSPWRSALVAGLFAAHPLAVESVAWISELKNVLSTAALLAALLLYDAWVRAPARGRWIATCGVFAAGLLAKPMLVTFPAVLLVLDAWPYARLRTRADLWSRVREKLPLFALAGLSCAVTIFAQDHGGALIAAEDLPLSVRIPNAVVSGALYLWRALWPARLAVFYPHPGASLPAAHVVAAAASLVALTLLALWQRQDRPFILAGWLWYLITVAPVIGIVQVGMQAMADRYTYVPLIGIFIAAVWSVPRVPRIIVGALGSGVVLSLAIASRVQAATWRDSTTLFQHAIDAVPRNWLAYKNLGVEQFNAGDLTGALRSFEIALQLHPQDPDLWADTGTCQLLLGKLEGAIETLGRAVLLKPRDGEMWFNLGLAHALAADASGAADALTRLREVDPERARLFESRLPQIAAHRQ